MRKIALVVAAGVLALGGTAAGAPLVAEGTAALAAAGFGPVQYLEVRDAQTLAPVARAEREARLLVAAYLGKTRLIDNVAVVPV